MNKLAFCTRHGVQEFYLVDPIKHGFSGWQISDEGPVEILKMDGWTSPLLGITFRVLDGDIQVLNPDGTPMRTFHEICVAEKAAKAQADAARTQTEIAETQAEAAEEAKEKAESRAAALAARLAELGVDPDQI